MKKNLFILSIFISGCFFCQSPVNAYAQVTLINSATLVLGAVDEQYDSFEDGEQIILMQMQGAQVSDTSNSSSFGTISGAGSAGLYEVCTILSHTENAGVPDTLKLSAPLQNTYDLNGTVQVISFPVLGGGSSFTTTSAVSCKAFDGQKGGVLCFEVQGNLYLQHNISADGMGFKGGMKTPGSGGGYCDPNLYAGPYGMNMALKGQGIFKNSSALNAGRAHAVNGGGGGVVHNGGGGGGGNYTAGGIGGPGYIHKCPNGDGYGYGGHDLQWYINPNRFFMGGGGGGGHDNDGYGTSGASGGGIIIIKCDSLVSSGSCSGVTISANGLNAASDAQDGKGGGGAGGTILFDAVTIRSTGSCPLKISANGGNGGNVTISKQHAGGGGGGQGVIMLLCGGSEQNVTLETKNGKGGKNMTSFSATYAGDAWGVDNSGIFIGIPGDTLPAVFSSFTAAQDSFTVDVVWTTTYEKNVAVFELQKSDGTTPWQVIATVAGHGQGLFTGVFNYAHTDAAPFDGTNYYRLKITDTLGCSFYSPMRNVNYTEPEYTEDVVIFPNPVQGDFIIRSNYKFEAAWFKVYDARGREVPADFEMIDEKKYKVYAPTLAEGVYLVRYLTNGQRKSIKFTVLK